MRSIIRDCVGLVGIGTVSGSAFLLSPALGLFSVGVFCLLIAVGDRLMERSQTGDRRRTR